MKKTAGEAKELDLVQFDDKGNALLQRLKEDTGKLAAEEAAVIHLTLENRNEEAYQYFLSHVVDKQKVLLSTIDEFSSYVIQSAEKINKTNEQEAQEAVFIVIAILVIAAVLLFLLGIAIAKAISQPVKKMQELMSKAENGDLSVKADDQTNDEIGQLATSFNGMMNGFQGAIGNIIHAANSVSSAAQQISATTEEIASGSATKRLRHKR
ncbi:HAMP domain-containing protein [Marinicrinis lubricantis]|uniref:HAMP domain-containing protein n=1 Tax=Marinicrinis lubricantis TaxID=2086470 RepID=A0ABW1ISV6_9BACL